MPANENEAPLSEAARDLDNKVRGQVSDLTDLDVRRPEKWSRNLGDRTRRLLSRLLGKKRLRRLEGSPLTSAFILIMAILLALVAYLALFVAPGNDDGNAAAPQPTAQATSVSEEPATVEPERDEPAMEDDPVPMDAPSDLSEILSAPAAGDDASVDDGAVVPAGPDDDESGAEGPLSGTWTMWWANVLGSRNDAFTIRFIGAETGTLEILNDETEYDTFFTVDGDLVRFGFTRRFDLDPGYYTAETVSEISLFVGEFEDGNSIDGEWQREGWDCSPGREPECITGGEPNAFPARLFRND